MEKLRKHKPKPRAAKNHSLARLLALLKKRMRKTRHDRKAEYDRLVASGEIQFLDFHGLTIPVRVGPTTCNGRTFAPTGPLMQVSGGKDGKIEIKKAKIVKAEGGV